MPPQPSEGGAFVDERRKTEISKLRTKECLKIL